MSRHGITITCSYCHETGHNIKGCNQRKAGILPNLAERTTRRGPRAIPDDVSDDEIVLAQQDDGQGTQEEVQVTQEDGQLTQEEVHVDGQVTHEEAHVDGHDTHEEVIVTQDDEVIATQDDGADTPVVFQANSPLLSLHFDHFCPILFVVLMLACDDCFVQVQDFGFTMLHRMQQSRPVPREDTESILPDSSFISLAASSHTSAQTTTTTNQGNQTMKLLKMKREKERQMAARRDAALEAMNEMAEKKAEEAEAKRQEIARRKAESSQRRRRAAQEKKALESAARKEAAAARKAALQEEKEARALEAMAAKAEATLKRKEDQEAKRAMVALKRKEDQEAKKVQQEEAKRLRAEQRKQAGPSGHVPKKPKRVNMFDEFR